MPEQIHQGHLPAQPLPQPAVNASEEKGTAWLPSYFMRTFQWDVAKVGLWYGLSSIVFGALGINLGGLVAGWLRSRGYVDANLRVGLICLACFAVVGVLAPLVRWLSENLCCPLRLICSTAKGNGGQSCNPSRRKRLT